MYNRIRVSYHKAKSWLLWLPFRKLRRSLHNEFSEWGSPLETLKAISVRLARTEAALDHAHKEWDRETKRANNAEKAMICDRMSQTQKRVIAEAFGVDLGESRN